MLLSTPPLLAMLALVSLASAATASSFITPPTFINLLLPPDHSATNSPSNNVAVGMPIVTQAGLGVAFSIIITTPNVSTVQIKTYKNSSSPCASYNFARGLAGPGFETFYSIVDNTLPGIYSVQVNTTYVASATSNCSGPFSTQTVVAGTSWQLVANSNPAALFSGALVSFNASYYPVPEHRAVTSRGAVSRWISGLVVVGTAVVAGLALVG